MRMRILRKKSLLLLIMLFAVGWSAKASGSCGVVFNLYDSYGDGWNGNKLVVSDGNSLNEELSFNQGRSATFTFIIADGSHITLSWIDGDYGDECSFSMQFENGYPIYESGSLSGTSYEFDLNCDEANTPVTITVASSDEELGIVSGGGEFVCGETCTVTATPNEGYSFWFWGDENGAVSTEANYTFTVTGPRDLTAVFRPVSNANYIVFVDPNVEAICLDNWDTDGDTYMSYEEAAAVTDLGGAFSGNTEITSFDELVYFTSLTSIGESAFESCESLTSIVIPNSVTSFRESAFIHCLSLTSFVIPNSVTRIEDIAFNDCTSLTSIVIPNSVTTVGVNPFAGCTNLETITVETGNQVYDSRNNCNAIIKTSTNTLIAGCASTIIPNTVTSIGFGAFALCPNLTTIIIPSSVTSICNFAFTQCTNLTSITIPNSVTDIGDEAFEGCVSLISVMLPCALTTIGDWAFAYCESLTSLNIPGSVTSIGSNAFGNCTNLSSITAQALTPPALGSNVFQDVDKSIPVYIPGGTIDAYSSADGWSLFTNFIESNTIVFADENVEAICVDNWDTDEDGYLSYAEAALVTDLGNAFQYNEDISSFDELQYFTGLTSVVLNNGGFEEGCFIGCSNLTSIVIPNSVTAVGDLAFQDCSSLTSIYIPNSVTAIGENAFSFCSGLTAVNIPNSVTTIGPNAFESCESLISVTLPDALTTIDDNVFGGCSSLTSIKIPGSVTSIGEGAFSYCTALISMTVNAIIPPDLGDYAFQEVNKNIPVYVPGGTTNVYSAADGWDEFFNYIETNIFFADPNVEAICLANWDFDEDGQLTFEEAAAVTDLGGAFQGNEDITSFNELQYFTGLDYIGMFQGCHGLASITLPNSAEGIDNYAFEECASLTSITIPSSVTEIGEGAFYGTGITSITIPSSVSTIGGWLFGECANLEQIIVEGGNPIYDSRGNCNAIIETSTNTLIAGCKNTTIPNTVASIEARAFYGCTGLTSIVIPSSVEYIGDYAFGDCTGLTSMIIFNTNIEMGDNVFEGVDIPETMFVATDVSPADGGGVLGITIDGNGNNAEAFIGSFDMQNYAVEFVTQGNGQVSSSNSVMLAAHHNEGWSFAGWSLDGEVVSYESAVLFIGFGSFSFDALFETCELEPDPEVLLSGRFSISGCSTVGFARSNAIMKGDLMGSMLPDIAIGISLLSGIAIPGMTLELGENQWDRMTYDPETISSEYMELMASSGVDVFPLYFTKGGIECWHILKGSEWDYLLNQRDTEARFAFAKVNDVNGLVILPDDWNTDIYPFAHANEVTDYQNNVITADTWLATLEPAGAVFLPVNGLIRALGELAYDSEDGEIGAYPGLFISPDGTIASMGLELPMTGDIVNVFTTIYGTSLRLAQITETSPVTITVAAEQTERGIVSGGGEVNCGQTCTVTATANPGYVFQYWKENGQVVSTETVYSFKATSDRNLFAQFANMGEVCNVVFALSGQAVGWGGEALNVNYGEGEDAVSFQMTMPTPEEISIVELLGSSETVTQTYSVFIDRNATVNLSWQDASGIMGDSNASFAVYYAEGDTIIAGDNQLQPYNFDCVCEGLVVDINLVVDPEGAGTITTDGPMYYGETTTVTAEENGGYQFVNWTFNGIEVSTEPIYSFVVTEVGDLVAHFEEIEYEITAIADPVVGGVITGGGRVLFELNSRTGNGWYGASVTVSFSDGSPSQTFTLDSGYYTSYALEIENGVHVTMTWNSGQYDSQCLLRVQYENCFDFENGYTGYHQGPVIFYSYPAYEHLPFEFVCFSGPGSYSYDELCVLTAVPNEGYSFESWTENGETVSTEADYGFHVWRNMDLVANFSLNNYEITATANPEVGGSVTGAGNYDYGTQCTLTATPNEGYGFVAWTENDVTVSTDADYSFTVTGERSLVAVFLPTYVITAEANNPDYGSVTGGGTFIEGESCTLTATPNEGYTLINWTLNGTVVSTEPEYTFTVTAAGDYTANFQLKNYVINASANPSEGGMVNGAGNFDHGTECTLTATANVHYHFTGWMENGLVVCETPIYTFTVTSNRTFEATFAVNGYYSFSLAVEPEESGTLYTAMYHEIETPYETEEPVEETDISVVAKANEGWRFAYWTANGEMVPDNNVYTFHLSGNTDLVAHFEQCELETEPDPDLLSGRFSISGCTTVGFAKGNVIAQIQIDTINPSTEYYNPTSASWEFAETQYYRQEYNAEYIDNYGIGNLLSEGMDLVWDMYRYVGLVDIGCWHNLTGAEWEYLLNGRPTAVRYAFAKVNDVAGLLVLPDDWVASTYLLNSPNTVSAYETNTISQLDWENMLEPAGALFLPANGMLMSSHEYYHYELDDGTGNPIGLYGSLLFHPDLGLTNGGAAPFMNEITSTMFSSMRLAQIMDQETSTVTVAVEETQTSLGMVSGGGIFACGAECTIMAIANDGYVFQYWLEGGEVVSVDASYTFTVEGDRNLTAVFAEESEVCIVEFELYSDDVALGWGGEALQLTFDDGTPSISLTMPAPEVDWNAIRIAQLLGNYYDFDFPQSRTINVPIHKLSNVELSWLALSTNIGPSLYNSFSASYETGEPILVNIGNDHSPISFLCNCTDIHLYVNPVEAGYIVTDGELFIGESVTLTAFANYGYSFVNWTFNGIEVSTEPIYSFEVTEPGNIVANFELVSFEITATSNPVEGGIVNGQGLYEYNTNCTLTAEPNEGYTFMYWSENGDVVSSNAVYTFQVTADRDLVANFSPPLTITTEGYPYEGGIVNGGGEYNYGAICTITAEPNDGYIFNYWTENGIIVSTAATYSFSVTHNCTLAANFSHPNNAGILSGMFSVGENERVNFSQGNLQYQASNRVWRFAANQYDYIGSDNSNISASYSGWIDLFGWGTSGYNHGAVCYQPWSTSTTYSDYYAYGSDTYNLFDQTGQADWGSNAINNGGNTANSSFRTLSYEEWQYILYSRNTVSGIRFAKARVNGVNGMILLPDDWKSSIYRLYSTNNDYSSCDSNVITAEIWSNTLEANGAVFLPAAGTRYGTSINDVGSYGFYWSSSYQDSYDAWRLPFASRANTIPIRAMSRNYGQSVRLVSSLLSISASPNPEEGGTITGRLGEYVYGTECVLSATPNEGYAFSEWIENGVTVSTESNYSFTVTNDRSLTAVFLPTYVIYAEANHPDYGFVSGDGSFVVGETCTLTATANEGYGFIAWTEDGEEVSTEAVYSFTVTEERHLVAVFNTLYTISANANPIEGGHVSFVGGIEEITVHDRTSTNSYVPLYGYWANAYLKCEMVYPAAELGSLAEADITSMKFYASRTNASWGNANFQVFLAEVENDQISAFYGPGTIVYEGALSIIDGVMIVDFNSPYHYNGGNLLVGLYNTVTGSWASSPWYGETVSGASIQGNNSSSLDAVSPTQRNFLPKTTFAFESSQAVASFPSGVSCTVAAQPNEGYEFINWTENGETVHTEAEYSFTVEGNRSLVANFSLKHYDITVAANPEEGGTVTGGGNYNHGTQCTLTATANVGYTFINWTLNGTVVSTEPSYTFTVTAAGDYTANFQLNNYVINASANPSEGGTVSGAGTYDHGTECTLAATANTGYNFDNWTLDGNVVSTEPSYTFTVTSAGDYVANFSLKTYDITATVTPTNAGSVTGTGNYTHGTQCTLTAIAAEGYAFSAWLENGATVSNDVTYGFTVTGERSLVASFLPTYVITAVANNADYGTVTGGGTFMEGETCTLTASPNEGYVFSVWTEDGETVSNDATYSFTVTGERSLVAVFLPIYVITAEANDPNYGTVTGGGTFVVGTTCTLVATPAEGYEFINWTENGETASTDAEYSFTVEGNRSLVANFSLKHYDITVAANPEAGGTVTGGGNYGHFETCTLTATANWGYTFINWTLNGNVVSTEPEYTFTVTAAGDYTANFQLNSYAINASANPSEGGTVNGAGNYDHGTECTLTATANVGYTFVNWTLDGNEVGTDPTYTFTVYGEATYVANFSLNLYEITAIANPVEGGTITGAGNYYHGDECILTAIPIENYTFLYWTENGNYLSSDAIYSFVATSDRSLVAIFAGNEQTISLSPGWTWLSSYIEMDGIDGLGMLENGLYPNGVMIKSQRDGFLSYAGGMWIGTLDGLTNEKMYLVNTNEPAEITFTGPVANMMNHPITLGPNWTWIGYPSPFALDINDALANLNASEGDVVKTQSVFATYSVVDGWTGSLSHLTPGVGLMYQSYNNQTVTFTYGIGMSRSLKANLTAENNHWVPDIHAYPNNMNIMAVVELNGKEVEDERYELAIFDGDECRGSVRLVYVESLRRYVAFLSVAGEEDTELCLALYDTRTGKAYYNTTDCLNFEANAVLGSLRLPYVARFGENTGLDDWGDPNVELYPNPVSRGHSFQIELPAESNGARVSIINALGSVVTTTDVYAKPATLRAPDVPGVYTIKVVTDKQGTYCRKLIVK